MFVFPPSLCGMQVMFICNHCPFVVHLKKVIVKLTEFYMKVVKQITVAKVYIFLSSAAGQTCKVKTHLIFFFLLFLQKGLAVVAISSNSVATHPQVIVNSFPGI